MNSEYEQYKMDGLHEECGVFGMYDLDGGDVASSIYYGLFSLQHRGQESCGIAVSDTNGPKRKVDVQKGMGLVNEVFDEENLSKLKGNIGVGHVRYSTAGASNSQNVQPLVLNVITAFFIMLSNFSFMVSLSFLTKYKIEPIPCRYVLHTSKGRTLDLPRYHPGSHPAGQALIDLLNAQQRHFLLETSFRNKTPV